MRPGRAINGNWRGEQFVNKCISPKSSAFATSQVQTLQTEGNVAQCTTTKGPLRLLK